MTRGSKDILRIGQFWLLLAVVITASLYPLPPGSLRHGLDKVLHCATYLFLMVSLDFAFASGRRLLTKLVLLLFCSWLIEIVQQYLPPRQYSLGDLLANLAGLLLGLLLALLIGKIRVNKTRLQAP
jgi:VanZ family protein